MPPAHSDLDFSRARASSARNSPISASICARLRVKASPFTSSLDWMAGTAYASRSFRSGLFPRTRLECAQFADQRQHLRAIARKGVTVHIELGLDGGHGLCLPLIPIWTFPAHAPRVRAIRRSAPASARDCA